MISPWNDWMNRVQSLAAIDVLSMANLINYFGKCERVDDVDVAPVLIKKGSTKVISVLACQTVLFG